MVDPHLPHAGAREHPPVEWCRWQRMHITGGPRYFFGHTLPELLNSLKP